jgi:hypothetical protein
LKVELGAVDEQVSSQEVDGATWSGRDRSGQLIYAKLGKIFRRKPHGDVEVADLCGETPDPQPAPEWAHRALERA